MKAKIALCTVMMAGALFAEDIFNAEEHSVTPLSIGIASPLQLPDSEWRVWGLRFGGFYGSSHEVIGIDFGACGRTTIGTTGIQLTGFNRVCGDVRGIQFGLVANSDRLDVRGVQLGGVNWDQGSLGGVQLGIVNLDAVFYGVQLGFLNWDGGLSYGAQAGFVNVDVNEYTGAAFGFVNKADRMSGFQMGLVNLIDKVGTGVQFGLFNGAAKFDGVQIGLLNVIQNSPLPIMPFLNANF